MGTGLINGACHFDLTTALQLAWASDLIYSDPQQIEQTAVSQWNASDFRFLDVESTQCLVTANRDAIVVCFRGTEADQVEDWIVDLDFNLVPGPLQGRVHEGFYDALSCVWHLLDLEVSRLQSEAPRRLLVTGHSMGAALGSLAAGRWHDAGRPVDAMYTFGQPRVGDRAFARNFDFAFRSQAFRMVNNLDIVTRTPPRSLGYRHFGTLIYITDRGELAGDVDWWDRFVTGWRGTIETILDWGGEGIDDHRMSRYRQRIWNVHKSQEQSQRRAA